MPHFEAGSELYRQRRIREAVEQFRCGVLRGEDPETAASDRWMTMMLAGEFEDAWEESDRVMSQRAIRGETCKHLPSHMRFVWDGRPLAGRDVLVRCYHGLGDVIQFIRYTAILRRMCRRVRVQAQAELLELLGSVEGIDELISLEDADPEFEVEIELLEVPHALRTTLATIPANVPYLRVNCGRVAAKRKEMAGEDRFRVGLIWASGAWRSERSVPLRCFSFLSEMKGVAVIGLQRGPAVEEVEWSGPEFVHSEWSNYNVVDTAATMMNLDLVISTDTMAAHLAGALGIPTWTLLHTDSDWRWMVDRPDSPWYPGMQLFRQTEDGGWRGVMEQVRASLATSPKSRIQIA